MDAVRLEIRERSQDFVERLRARSAAPHPGHGHRARPDGQGRAARALAQRQVQSRPARERAARRGEHDRDAASAGRRSDRGRADRRGHHPRRAALRLHGAAQRPRGTCRGDGARQDPEIRSRAARSTTPATRRSFRPAGARACRAGARRCSPSCITTPSGRAPTSRFPARKSWKSASNSRSSRPRRPKWRRSPSPLVGATLFTQVIEPTGGRRAPLLREAGKVSPKATDGVWKAGRLDRKFAVTFVQAVWRRSSGPHPIRRFAPPSPASWGEDSARRSEMCEHCSPQEGKECRRPSIWPTRATSLRRRGSPIRSSRRRRGR